MKILIEKCWDSLPDNRPSFSEIVMELNNIILDIAIPDELAISFWKSSFTELLDVPIQFFIEKFFHFLKIFRENIEDQQIISQYEKIQL